jgi:hypothetical protein
MAAATAQVVKLPKPKRVPLPTGKGYRYGGRVKGTPNKTGQEFRAACASYSMEGLARLISMGRQDQDLRLAFDAWKFIIEQAHGRAPQGINLLGAAGEPLDLATLTDAQLTILIARFELAASSAEVAPAIEGTATEVAPGSEAESGHAGEVERDQE